MNMILILFIIIIIAIPVILRSIAYRLYYKRGWHHYIDKYGCNPYIKRNYYWKTTTALKYNILFQTNNVWRIHNKEDGKIQIGCKCHSKLYWWWFFSILCPFSYSTPRMSAMFIAIRNDYYDYLKHLK